MCRKITNNYCWKSLTYFIVWHCFIILDMSASISEISRNKSLFQGETRKDNWKGKLKCNRNWSLYKVRYQNAPELVMFKKIYIYIRFNIIPFEILTLCSNIPAPAFLPLMKSNLEVVFCTRVDDLLRFTLNLGNGVKAAVFEQHFQPGEEMVVRMY